MDELEAAEFLIDKLKATKTTRRVLSTRCGGDKNQEQNRGQSPIFRFPL